MNLSPEKDNRMETPDCPSHCNGNLLALVLIILFITGLAQA